MAHKLPALPYDFDALEPHIDAETMTIHHDKHHQAYVNNLNAALEAYPEQQEMSALELMVGFDDLPDGLKPAVQKQGGGHVNHSMFWTIMGPDGGGEPGGMLAGEINDAFGSFDEFKAAFKAAAGGVFGSGWAWLVINGDGNLVITTTANQDNPVFTSRLHRRILQRRQLGPGRPVSRHDSRRRGCHRDAGLGGRAEGEAAGFPRQPHRLVAE